MNWNELKWIWRNWIHLTESKWIEIFEVDLHHRQSRHCRRCDRGCDPSALDGARNPLHPSGTSRPPPPQRRQIDNPTTATTTTTTTTKDVHSGFLDHFSGFFKDFWDFQSSKNFCQDFQGFSGIFQGFPLNFFRIREAFHHEDIQFRISSHFSGSGFIWHFWRFSTNNSGFLSIFQNFWDFQTLRIFLSGFSYHFISNLVIFSTISSSFRGFFRIFEGFSIRILEFFRIFEDFWRISWNFRGFNRIFFEFFRIIEDFGRIFQVQGFFHQDFFRIFQDFSGFRIRFSQGILARDSRKGFFESILDSRIANVIARVETLACSRMYCCRGKRCACAFESR